nr:AMP-binding protein [Ramlibacter aurantiacus]
MLDQEAARDPDRLFFVCRDPDLGIDVRWTLRELKSHVDRLARGLMQLGIERGDKVGVLSPNRPEWLLANFALPKIGAVLVTVNTHSRQQELGHILAQAELRALILQGSHRGNPTLGHLRALLATGSYPGFRHAILLDGEEPGTLPFDQVLAAADAVEPAALAERQSRASPSDAWQIQFTSGTTGSPKGAMLTHFGTVNNARIFGSAAGMRPGDRLVSAMPMFHTAGNITEVLGLLVHGGTLVKATAFEPGWMLRLIHEERPTILAAVPTMVIAMLNHPSFMAGEVDTASLRLWIAGGTAMPLRVLERVRQEFGAEPQIGFGMTELSPMVSCTAMGDSLERKSQTVGRPLPHVEVKIADSEGATCRPGEPGELLVRSFGAMAGYYRQPEATARTLDAEGWLHSGDLASMDEDGTLRIVGRIKDMIKRGGENVYPAEVEDFLARHPKIAQAQVVGVPDGYMGEESAAFVQLRPGESMTPDELAAHCREHMARHKLPKYIRFVTRYPLTASGKVMKYALRENLLNELNAGDSR